MVAFVLSCWAFFSLFGVIKSPTANVRMLKKIAIGITALAICFIERPLDLKTNATNTSISMEFKSGFWMKDGNNFVNIENVLPDATLSNIHIYEFDDQFNLRTIIDAKNGKFDDGNWDLTQITVKNFEANEIITEKIEKGN